VPIVAYSYRLGQKSDPVWYLSFISCMLDALDLQFETVASLRVASDVSVA